MRLIEIAKMLQDNADLTLLDLVKISNTNKRALSQRLNTMKNKNRLKYDTVQTDNGYNYINFEILDKKVLQQLVTKEEQARVKKIKTDLEKWQVKQYIDDIYTLNEIINNPLTKMTDKVKALQEKGKRMKYTESQYAWEYIQDREVLK
ncbi:MULTISPECIES: hypothetical protein [unclassified Gemella]|uniref:hypothetical protein n=1 Tax=unclassified Gemella TaxID=2624949 RepID=UPI001073E1BF|nr:MULTISPECIES: hypothetical protein [unclassified Gemella]MBF0710578.1 hypothetical protein [Gemella sp. GL1.1]MBF0746443.1 hypothetical protein [Gemella sp. 19428wG2_WT2a]NYS27922.1 hypothetical protein [Gemella sp. GL1]TFU60226.1 hypothetical protein E4T67_01945 [Gemella sp. WT2a]